MDIIRDLAAMFITESDIKINESIDTAEVIVKTNNLLIPEFKELKELMDSFQKRDTVRIDILSIKSVQVSYHSILNSELSRFISSLVHLKEKNININEYTVKIRVKKEIDSKNRISIFSFEDFITYLEEQAFTSLLFSFGSILSSRNMLVFEMLNEEGEGFGTDTMHFIPHLGRDEKEQEYVIPDTNADRKEKLDKLNSGCTFLMSSKYFFIPDDFHLSRPSGYEKFNKIMDRLCLVFSMVFLANTSNLDIKLAHFRIDGIRRIDNSFEYNAMELLKSSLFFNIYKWVYTGGSFSDKIETARNIITLNIDDKNILTLGEDVLSTMRSNYSINLKENVSQYIQVKNKVSDLLMEMSKRADIIIDTFLRAVRVNIFGIIFFYIVVLVSGALMNKSFQNIFTPDITYISLAILGAAFLVLIGTINQTNHKIKRFKSQYGRIKDYYLDILEKEDIHNIFNKDRDLKNDIKYMEKSVLKYVIICIFVIILFIAATVYLGTFK